MLSRRELLLGTVLLLAIHRRGASAATPGAASHFIKSVGEQAIGVLQRQDISLDTREAHFRGLLEGGFDLAFIARFTLGRHWRRASPGQQAEFAEVFGEYILQTYSMRLGGYAGEKLTIVDERPAGEKDVIVHTRIDRPSGAPIDARWRVRTTGERLRIIDIMVEGVSMAVTQRNEFASVAQNRGLDELVEILRAMTNKMTAVER